MSSTSTLLKHIMVEFDNVCVNVNQRTRKVAFELFEQGVDNMTEKEARSLDREWFPEKYVGVRN